MPDLGRSNQTSIYGNSVRLTGFGSNAVASKISSPLFNVLRVASCAGEIAHAFGIEIDKDVVRRILARHFRSPSGNGGPSWLTLIGDMKDSLWSVDLFRCESIVLKSYWVMVVMDLFTRRIVGVGAEAADHVNGPQITGILIGMSTQTLAAPSRLPSGRS